MKTGKMAVSLEAQAFLRRVEVIPKQGHAAEVVKKLRQVLTNDPEHTEAMAQLAVLAFRAGEQGKCIEILERAVTIAPQDATLHYRVGLAHCAAFHYQRALASFRSTAELEPENATVQLKLGGVHLAMGDKEQAMEAFQSALLLQPALVTGLQDTKMPEGLRTQIRTANEMLKEKYAEIVNMTLKHLHQEYPGEDLSRIETSFHFLQGEEERRYCHELQRPELLLFPDMQAQPWFEREEFDWVPGVEAAFRDIRGELEDLLAERAEFEPYIRGGIDASNVTSYLGTDFSSLANNHIWDSFHLNKGTVIEENCRRCPRTSTILDKVPMARARDFMPEVFFSVLRAGGHIVPHFGQMNIRLTAHLGIIIPEGCGLRAGTETRHWEEGSILVFDDSFEHEAWNHSNSDRIVLIFEIWHPNLTPVEIAGLQKFFELRGEWMARLSIKVNRHTTL